MNAIQPALRIVPLNEVLLHEQVEARRVEQLLARLRSEWLLKNPPIVAQFDSKYIVLDGATRTTALKRLACRDILVQIVDYNSPGVVLESWNHLLFDLPKDVLTSLRAIPGLDLDATTAESAEQALTGRKSVATCFLADGSIFSLHSHSRVLLEQARLLNQVVATYEGRVEMYRVAHTDLERLLAEHGRLGALFAFPHFRTDEIRQLGLGEVKLPMGITRHIIPGRALRINIPLAILEKDEPLESKNAWLERWMQQHMAERHVRYYQEPVFLFDE